LAYVGCIAGAILIDRYRQGLIDAGFATWTSLTRGRPERLCKAESSSGCLLASGRFAPPDCGSRGLLFRSPLRHCGSPSAACRPCSAKYDVNEYAASVRVFALKP